MRIKSLIVILSLAFSLIARANDSHTSKKDGHTQAAEKHSAEKHDKKDAHEHAEEGEEHEHRQEQSHEEENSQVGPGKGIVSASEDEGIQISPQAEKNFEIQRVPVSNATQVELPASAIVTAGTEVNLYRYRSGHYKRIDFEFVSKAEKKIVVKSKDLKSGDEVVVHGTGLLRIAEIAAFGGAPEGHSH